MQTERALRFVDIALVNDDPCAASWRQTLKMMPIFPLPMAVAASTLPGLTLARAASTWRVKKGVAPNTSGTMAPLTPMAVPTIRRVRGMRKISRITKGMERKQVALFVFENFCDVAYLYHISFSNKKPVLTNVRTG